MNSPSGNRRHVALLLVEGETEEEFYQLFLEKHCHSTSKKLKNLKGNFNINNKLVDASYSFAWNNPTDTFDVYVCIDQERPSAPVAYNHVVVEEHLRKLANFQRLIPCIAVLMIESLFFLDIEGIYAFLRTPVSHRVPDKFGNFRQLRHEDLGRLFKAAGKQYRKGYRTHNFISALDLSKIATADELANLIRRIGEHAPA